MRFDELNASVPYMTDGKLKSVRIKPWGVDGDVVLAMPGRHADQTSPPGGDYVVMVTDAKVKWKNHQFSHGDIFLDLEAKATQGPYQDLMKKDAKDLSFLFMRSYMRVVQGERPEICLNTEYTYLNGLNAGPFLRAAQALAVAEHRRYARYEAQWGGRFLPFRFGAGIVEGLWTAGQAIEKQKRGRPGVEWLERDYGVPFLTQELMAE